MYIHIDMLLEFVNMRESKEFKRIHSKDFNKDEKNSFKLILPNEIEVDSISIGNMEDPFAEGQVLIKDKQSMIIDLEEIPHILLWDSELYSTNKEKNVCLNAQEIDNGLLWFEGFSNIPLIITSHDIIRTVEGFQEV